MSTDNNVRNFKNILVTDLKKTAKSYLKINSQMVKEGTKADFGTSKILEDLFLFPSEIRGFNRAIKAIEDIFTAEERKRKGG